MLFVDGAQRLAANCLKGAVPRRDLDEKRIIVGRDHRTGGDIPAVETDAGAAAGIISRDFAVVRREVVGRILGCDTALNGITVHMQVGLLCKPDLRMREGRSLGDQDLRTHHVDSRDDFGDRVLHLDAGVHFNKVVVSVFVDQEFDRARVDIVDRLGNLDGVVVQGVANLLRHAPGRSHFHYLLVTALQRTVALAQMTDTAVLIGQDLNLDMLGLDKVFLNKDIVVSKRLLGLAAYEVKGRRNVFRLFAQTHASSAAAGSRLQNHRKSEFLSLLERLFRALQRDIGARNDRNAARHRDLLGLQLVAHLGKHLGGRPDKDNAGILARLGKLGVFREETVAGMDRFNLPAFGQRNDLINGKVGAQRASSLSNEIGLVRLGAEKSHGIFFGVNGKCADAQVVAGAENADRDLTAVCRHHLAKSMLRQKTISFICTA